jgi:hypothetical protein
MIHQISSITKKAAKKSNSTQRKGKAVWRKEQKERERTKWSGSVKVDFLMLQQQQEREVDVVVVELSRRFGSSTY